MSDSINIVVEQVDGSPKVVIEDPQTPHVNVSDQPVNVGADMSAYDADADGIIDDAAALGGLPASDYALQTDLDSIDVDWDALPSESPGPVGTINHSFDFSNGFEGWTQDPNNDGADEDWIAKDEYVQSPPLVHVQSEPGIISPEVSGDTVLLLVDVEGAYPENLRVDVYADGTWHQGVYIFDPDDEYGQIALKTAHTVDVSGFSGPLQLRLAVTNDVTTSSFTCTFGVREVYIGASDLEWLDPDKVVRTGPLRIQDYSPYGDFALDVEGQFQARGYSRITDLHVTDSIRIDAAEVKIDGELDVDDVDVDDLIVGDLLSWGDVWLQSGADVGWRGDPGDYPSANLRVFGGWPEYTILRLFDDSENEVATFESNGYVGLRNTSPSASLDIQADTGQTEPLLSLRDDVGTPVATIENNGDITAGLYNSIDVPQLRTDLDNLDWSTLSGKPATATRWPAWGEVTSKPVVSQAQAEAGTDTTPGSIAADVLAAAVQHHAPETNPAGSGGQIQFNDDGSFGGFGTWDGTLAQLPGHLRLYTNTYDRLDLLTTFATGDAAVMGRRYLDIGSFQDKVYISRRNGSDIDARFVAFDIDTFRMGVNNLSPTASLDVQAQTGQTDPLLSLRDDVGTQVTWVDASGNLRVGDDFSLTDASGDGALKGVAILPNGEIRARAGNADKPWSDGHTFVHKANVTEFVGASTGTAGSVFRINNTISGNVFIDGPDVLTIDCALVIDDLNSVDGSPGTGHDVLEVKMNGGTSMFLDSSNKNRPIHLGNDVGSQTDAQVKITNAVTDRPALILQGVASQTAPLLSLWDDVGTEVSHVDLNGNYENTQPGEGVILASPDGTRYKVTVDNAGNLTTTTL